MRTTIEMAREAGIRDCTCDGVRGCLERFASLVRADERARMAEQPSQQEPGRNHWEDGDVFERIAAIKEQPAQQEPVAWMEMVVANLVREGVNKHKARELAQHFYTSPPAQKECEKCSHKND